MSVAFNSSEASVRHPRVGVAMPAYNAERFIRLALDSLVSQTFKDFHLLISDDASTDGTESICREYAAKDPRIHYVRQPKNLGQIQNFNYSLSQTRGEYFMWASNDDMWEPTCLERYVAVLDDRPDIDLVYSPHRGYNHATGTRVEVPAEVVPSCLENKRNNVLIRFLNQVPTLMYSMFRRQFLDEVIGSYRNFDLSDVFMTYQAATHGKIYVLEDSLYWVGTKTVERRPYSLTGRNFSFGPYIRHTLRLIWDNFGWHDRALLVPALGYVALAAWRQTRRTIIDHDRRFA
jgi:glycosyltransferase involved in cell wall biosynthesis